MGTIRELFKESGVGGSFDLAREPVYKKTSSWQPLFCGGRSFLVPAASEERQVRREADDAALGLAGLSDDLG